MTTPPTTTTTPRRSWRRIAYGALLAWMVLSFTMGALTKFYWGETIFGPSYAVKFDGWGYPFWFRFVVATGELVGAALLLNPRWRFLGAAMLFTITAGGSLTHLINQDPLGHSVSAPLHMVLAALVAYLANPSLVKQLFSPTAPPRPPSAPGSAGAG